MDLTYHLVMGTLLSKVATNEYTNEFVIISSLLPDLIGCSPFYINKFQKELKEKVRIHKILANITKGELQTKIEKTAYYITHSFFGVLGFALLSWLIIPEQAVLITIGYLSHILIDIPTHRDSWSFQPFYPINKLKIEGINWWESSKIYSAMWVLLVVIGFITLFV